MQIIPMEHRDIITGSTDPDPEAEIDSMYWREYWNILLPLFMSLLLGFSSCDDGDLPNPPERELVPASFSVEIEGDAETRLSIDDNVTNLVFHFETGDKIKLYDGCSAPHELTYNATSLKFEGSVCSGSTYDNYRAVYPASTTSAYNEVSISATQTAVNGSFDKASAPMIAGYNHEQNKLYFKPSFSFLKITVPDGYSKIVVSNYSSNDNNYYLTGNATLTYNSDVLVTKASGGKSSVSLVPASNQSTIPAGTYYMSVFPCTLSGLQVACYKGDKICFKCKAAGSNVADKKIARNEGIKLGNVSDSNWATCEAVNIGCIFTEGSQDVNYYIADRNLGSTGTSSGTEYPQGPTDPSNIWGPGWILPSDEMLEYWYTNRPNKDDYCVIDTEAKVFRIKKDIGLPYASVSLPLQTDDVGYYWGMNSSHYLYISSSPLIETNNESTSIPAYIRPVFKVPAQ